jgi:tripeptide aminopeptidase
MALKFHLWAFQREYFAGGENMHGRFEFVSVQTMLAVIQIIEIAKLNSTQL